jgi:hypothetical protein
MSAHSGYSLFAIANVGAAKLSESFQPARRQSVKAPSIENPDMQAGYDFSKLKVGS